MNQPVSKSVPKLIWLNIIFFAVTTLVGVIGTPLYIYHYGLSWVDVALFMFYAAVTGLGITVGYHRLFAHASYQAHPVVRFLLLFFGAAAFEQSALDWATQHRDHHRYVDTDQDPYSIKKGFFYAHIGWLIFWQHKVNYENSKDLQKDPLLMHQSRYYIVWAVGSGIVMPLVIGALTGHMLGAFIIAVCLRLTFVYHATFLINSVCHMFGNATYDIYASARDHWLVALLTYGEGYHNFHHRFPSDYRNGVRWYHWDPSKWLIAGLSYLGLTKHLMRVSEFRIVEARLAAENRLANDRLEAQGNAAAFANIQEALQLRYKQVRHLLTQWEEAHKHRAAPALGQAADLSENLRASAAKKLAEAKERFIETRQHWRSLVERDVAELQRLLLPASAAQTAAY